MKSRLIVACVATFLLGIAALNGAGGDVADAVMKGNKTALRALLQQKADVNAPRVDGSTALQWAVYRDDLEAADLLIRAGAKVDAPNREGVTPLMMACLYGNVSMINKLVKAGADVKQRGSNGQTPLMLAARNGEPEAIKVLIAAGAEVNAKETARGTTALMWAVEQKHPAAVKALLDGGADYRAKSAGAGLPRNYMAGQNAERVEAAVRRRAAAAAAGRTYEQQLAFEGVQGRFGAAGGLDAAASATARSNQPAAGAAAAAPPATAGQAPAGEAGAAAQPAAGGRGQGGRGGRGGGRGAQAPGAQPNAAAAPAAQEAQTTRSSSRTGRQRGGGLTALSRGARRRYGIGGLLLEAGADVNQPTGVRLDATVDSDQQPALQTGAMSARDANRRQQRQMDAAALATDNQHRGRRLPVQKPDMEHLTTSLPLDHGADPNGRIGQHAEPDDLHDAKFLESGAVPFIRAPIQRHGVDEIARRRRSEAQDRPQRHRADGGWHRLVKASPTNARSKRTRGGEDAADLAWTRTPRTTTDGYADGRSDEGPQRGGADAGGQGRQARHEGQREPGYRDHRFGERGPHVAGARLRRRAGTCRRAVRGEPPGNRRAHSQVDDRPWTLCAATQPRRRIDLYRGDLQGEGLG